MHMQMKRKTTKKNFKNLHCLFEVLYNAATYFMQTLVFKWHSMHRQMKYIGRVFPSTEPMCWRYNAKCTMRALKLSLLFDLSAAAARQKSMYYTNLSLKHNSFLLFHISHNYSRWQLSNGFSKGVMVYTIYIYISRRFYCFRSVKFI